MIVAVIAVIFLLVHGDSTASDVTSIFTPVTGHKTQPNKIISVHTACSREAVLAIFLFRDPFYGKLYTRGYPDQCVKFGNGSRELSLTIAVNECGAKVVEKKDGSWKYEVYAYVQHDKNLQQAVDNLILVDCAPDELIVSGRATYTGIIETNRTLTAPPVSTTMSPLTVDCWMEILRGRMPDVQPISKHVDVGEELSMVVKIKHADGVMAKVTNCIASDGTGDAQQELIDHNGCSIDPEIMPGLQEMHDSKTGTKIVFASFQAFKFPERDNLHLQCRVLICNSTCPLQPCASSQKWGFRRRMSREFYSVSGNILRQLDVFNSVDVKSPFDETSGGQTSASQEAAAMESGVGAGSGGGGGGGKQESMFCLNSTRMVIIIGVLLGVLLISLVVTICMCVRARELRRRLLMRQGFPYGPVHEYS